MKFKFWSNVIHIKFNGLTFHSLKSSSYSSLTQRLLQAYNFWISINNFQTTRVNITWVLCFILGRELCHESFFCFVFFLYFLKFFHNYLLNINYQGKISNIWYSWSFKCYNSPLKVYCMRIPQTKTLLYFFIVVINLFCFWTVLL